MFYLCSGTRLLGEGIMQGAPWQAKKCLGLREPSPSRNCSDRLTVASSGSSQIDCKEEPIL